MDKKEILRNIDVLNEAITDALAANINFFGELSGKIQYIQHLILKNNKEH